MPELDIVCRSSSGLKSDGLADDESHGLGFGFGLAHLLRGQGATVATMQHLMCDFMHERRKLLGGLHSRKKRLRWFVRNSSIMPATRPTSAKAILSPTTTSFRLADEPAVTELQPTIPRLLGQPRRFFSWDSMK